jgi:gephyrin
MEHRAKDRKSGYAMVLVEDALRMVLEAAPRLDPTTVPLHEALGHVVAEDVRAREPLPPFDASVMDGYAVVAEDGIGEFQVLCARVWCLSTYSCLYEH